MLLKVFPPAIDNTMVSTFKECPSKFEKEFIFGRREAGTSVHLAFGKLYASAMEIARHSYWGEGLSPEASVHKAIRHVLSAPDYEDSRNPESSKSLIRLAHAIDSYFQTFGFASDFLQPKIIDGKPALEFNFAIPLPISHPETGSPLLYTGRYDMWGTYEGQDYLLDDKTAKRGGDTWDKKWELRGQFLGYLWGHRQYRNAVNGMFIRSPILYKDYTQHLHTIKHYSDEMIAEWYNDLLYYVEEMVSLYDKRYPKNWSDSCTSYSGCPYTVVCKADRAFSNRWLENEFPEVIRWNPMGSFIEENK